MNALALAGLRARGWLERGCVVLDSETSGLGSKDVAVDICVLAIDGRVLFESLIALPPGVEMGEKAQQIHGIRPEMLASAPQFPQLRDELAEVLRDRTVAVFNADYDSRILDQTADAWHVDRLLVGRYECVMLLAQNAMSARKWPRLDQAAERFNIKALGAHRARVDAEVARGVLLKIAGVI